MPHHSCFKLNKTQPCKSSIYRFLKKYVARSLHNFFFVYYMPFSCFKMAIFSSEL